jgi:hypothetical protein
VFVDTISLSEADLRGLDKLLLFYRSKPEGRCSTVDDIEITQLRQNEIVATERFTDQSCRSDEFGGLVTVSILASKTDRTKGAEPGIALRRPHDDCRHCPRRFSHLVWDFQGELLLRSESQMTPA